MPSRTKSFRDEISVTVKNVINARAIHDISSLKKLKGHKAAYRIRTESYRIGVFIEEGTVEFAAFAHRKNIYSIFPLLLSTTIKNSRRRTTNTGPPIPTAP